MTSALWFVLGFLLAEILTIVRKELDYRAARTGSVLHPPVSRQSGVPHNPEEAAMRAVSKDSIRRGAEMQLEIAKAEGFSMTRKEAERLAEQMLTTADPLGGVR